MLLVEYERTYHLIQVQSVLISHPWQGFLSSPMLFCYLVPHMIFYLSMVWLCYVMKQCLFLVHDLAWASLGFRIWYGNKVSRPWTPWIVIITSWSLTNSTAGDSCFLTKLLKPMLCRLFKQHTHVSSQETLYWKYLLVEEFNGDERWVSEEGGCSRGKIEKKKGDKHSEQCIDLYWEHTHSNGKEKLLLLILTSWKEHSFITISMWNEFNTSGQSYIVLWSVCQTRLRLSCLVFRIRTSSLEAWSMLKRIISHAVTYWWIVPWGLILQLLSLLTSLTELCPCPGWWPKHLI